MKSIDEMCPNVGGNDIDSNVTNELVEKMSTAITAALKESVESTQETLEKINKESEENINE